MAYGINDIEHLSFKEGVRTRINMYLGSDDTDGIYQAFKEIINNSTDEALAGFGNVIEISVDEDKNCITVRDYGRGVPFGIRENGENVLISIYTESHTGGKFGKSVYQNSSGLNGIGGSAVCLSSEIFEVKSYRDGVMATFKAKEGVANGYKEVASKQKNGTYISFIPDKKVFKNMTEGFTFDKICSEIQNISYLNKGIKFIITNITTKEKKTFYSENGIVDFIKDKVSNPLMKPIMASAKDEIDELEIAFMWTGGKEASYVFVNGLYCPEGGSPITGAKTTLTTQIKKLSGVDMDSDLVRKGLVYVINCKVANPSFANQTKTKINNPNLRTLAGKAFKEGLETFASSNDADNILNMLIKFEKAEKAAEKARKAILETSKEIEKAVNSKMINTDKLKDADKLGANSTLLLVEGNSAASSMAKSRDYNKFGILALRGKLINSLSNNEQRISENEEVKLFLKAMGIIPGKYNSSKLRYGKVAICVDSDSDGAHIALLIMALLQFFAPQFIQEERLCWLRSPLYIVKKGKKESYYFSDEEFDKAKANNEVSGEIQRCKGLGSLSAEQAKNSMFNDEFQRMDILSPDIDSISLLNDLMGEDVFPRTKFLFENVDFTTIHE